MHQTSGRWLYGFSLSLVASVVWGSLPLILKGLLEELDPITTTWFRFSIAGVLIAIFLARRRGLPDPRQLSRPTLLLVGVCILGLLMNYTFYVFGLDRITPSSAQVLIQCAPMLLLLGGVVIYGERLNTVQWLGALVFVAGLVLFFNQRLAELFSSLTDYGIGLLWIVAAAVTWAVYALAQKQVLQEVPSSSINLLIYVAGTLVLLPISEPLSISGLTSVGWFLLILSCLNTIIAYGAFAEAMKHWEASRVSAILALQPVFTIGFMWSLQYLSPGYLPAEPLNALALTGAGMVVFGSMSTALFRSRTQAPLPATPLTTD